MSASASALRLPGRLNPLGALRSIGSNPLVAAIAKWHARLLELEWLWEHKGLVGSALLAAWAGALLGARRVLRHRATRAALRGRTKPQILETRKAKFCAAQSISCVVVSRWGGGGGGGVLWRDGAGAG